MTNNLSELLNKFERESHATNMGRHMHLRLQNVVIEDDNSRGDADLIARIKSCPNLENFFTSDSKTEAPIAGYINGKFISRRIDRLCINHDAHSIWILDYKTDTDCNILREKYIRQLNEYRQLLAQVYPGYDITSYILWTHDWKLEKVS